MFSCSWASVLGLAENIACAEVEAVLHEHIEVQEVAVFGIPDDRLGELVACAIYNPSGKALAFELFNVQRTCCRVLLEKYGRALCLDVSPATLDFLSIGR